MKIRLTKFLTIAIFLSLSAKACFATCAETLAACEAVARDVNMFPLYPNCEECDALCLMEAPIDCINDPKAIHKASKLGLMCQKDCGFK